MKKYQYAKTLWKGFVGFVIFGLTSFATQSEFANVTLGALVLMGINWFKNRNKW